MPTDSVEVLKPVETTPPHPLAMLQGMLERGADPDALKRMMDLAQSWKAEEARTAYQTAMNECVREMPLVVKEAQNSQTKSKYAKLEHVHRQIKPVYLRHGFSISWGTADCPLEKFVRLVASVMHKGGHTETKQFDLPLDGIGAKGNPIGAMNPIQAMGSTYSYGRRYGELLIFDITLADEDNDGQALDPQLLPDQILVINNALQDCREAGNEVNMTRFLDWLLPEVKAERRSLELVRQSSFTKALIHLHKKRVEKKEKPK